MDKIMASNITSPAKNCTRAGVTDPICDSVRDILLYINIGALAITIGVFGVISNVINMIVYKRLGFKESMNVNLFAISISDIGSLVTLLWTCVLANPGLIAAPVDFIPIELAFLTGGIPHTRFVRISCWLTVLVTVERCMCLVAPLKVKTIFTPRSSTISALIIFVFFLLTQILNNVGNRLDWKFDKIENRSRIGIVPTNLNTYTRTASVGLNIVSHFLSLCACLVSNFTLLYFLRRKSAWRSTMPGPAAARRSTAPGNGRIRRNFCCPTKATLRLNVLATVAARSSIEDNGMEPAASSSVPAAETSASIAARRDQRLGRMILLLSVIMILGILPSSVTTTLSASFKQFSMSGGYRNSFIVAHSIGFVFEAINASVNIFLYYMFSSNYRCVLDKMMLKCKGKNRRVGDMGVRR